MKISKGKKDDVWQSGVIVCFINRNVEVISHKWNLFVDLHKVFVINWMNDGHLQEKISRIQSPFYLILIWIWAFFESQSIFNYLSYVSKLVCLISPQTLIMYQIVSFIINVASQESRATSNKLETQWTEWIRVLKAIWIWHRH